MITKPECWSINAQDFPHNGKPEEKLAFCLHYAVLAPSTYNAQPWHFVIQDNAVLLFADRRYGLPVIDPEDRELIIACGCALFNLRLAIRAFGYNEITELVPDPQDKDLLARVKIGDKAAAPEQTDKELFERVTERHGNRGAFSNKTVPEDMLHALIAEASKEGAWLHVPGMEEKKVLVRMIAEGDHIQSSSKAFRREMASWIHPRRVLSQDGLPQDKVSHADIMSSLGPFAIRRFEMEKGEPANNEQLEAGSPVIAVLGSKSGGVVERLHTGQALMRVWLRAESMGLSMSSLNQACEVPELRIRVHDEINQQHGRAQCILRIGYGGQKAYTNRRPLDQVTSYGDATLSVKTPEAGGGKGFLSGFRKLFLAKGR